MAKHGVGERLVSQGGILLYHSRKSWSRFYLRILAVALAFCSVCFALGTKVNAAVPQQPSIYGEAAVLLDASTGQILYGKNIHQQMEPASLTKIMTCLIAIEEGDPDAVLSVSEQAVEDMEDSSTMDVVTGESLSLRELLYGLMLPSANDAANVIAEYFSGGNEGFAQKMNQRAQELELWDTHFVNPHGLPAQEHYSTAYDLARLTQTALAQDAFLTYAGASEYEIAATERHGSFSLEHTHLMMQPDSRYYDSRVIAGKTGWTPGAGTCLMTVARQGDLTLIAIVLKSDSDDIWRVAYQDTGKMLDFGFSNFRRGTVTIPEITEYPVSFFDEEGRLCRGSGSGSAESLSLLFPNGCDEEDVYLEMPQQQQLVQWEQRGLQVSVRYQDENGESWPWPLASAPVSLTLQQVSDPSHQEPVQSVMSQQTTEDAQQQNGLGLLFILLLVCAAGLTCLWCLARPGSQRRKRHQKEETIK